MKYRASPLLEKEFANSEHGGAEPKILNHMSGRAEPLPQVQRAEPNN
jgi:hypothetical protein